VQGKTSSNAVKRGSDGQMIAEEDDLNDGLDIQSLSVVEAEFFYNKTDEGIYTNVYIFIYICVYIIISQHQLASSSSHSFCNTTHRNYHDLGIRLLSLSY
jgi:hypothetical protein